MNFSYFRSFIQRLCFTIIINATLISCANTHKLCQAKSNQKSIEVTSMIEKERFSGPAKFLFDSSTYHLGIIKKGEILNREFFFRNIGAEELTIKLISACECTTVDWPVLPIQSGERKSLKISYNSKDKKGPQIVDLDISANTEPVNTYIKFELFVEE
ncbi:MAG: DUF1573 domain-containing protein [Saprospiraceae bacterium]